MEMVGFVIFQDTIFGCNKMVYSRLRNRLQIRRFAVQNKKNAFAGSKREGIACIVDEWNGLVAQLVRAPDS
jgi:hypothetical protein